MKAILVLVALALLAALAIEWHREGVIERAYLEQQRQCITYAKTLFPKGEVDPFAWCLP